jgi:hypothetical protein
MLTKRKKKVLTDQYRFRSFPIGETDKLIEKFLNESWADGYRIMGDWIAGTRIVFLLKKTHL